MEITKQYNQIGKDYLENKALFFSKNDNRGTQIMIEEMLVLKDKVVLDIGCGDGSDLLRYIKDGAKVIGIDSSEYMVEQAQKKLGDEVQISVGDYEDIPLKDKSVDIVAGRFSLHYLYTFDKAYVEMNRVLKPGGYIVLAVPLPTNYLIMRKEMKIEKDSDDRELVCVQLYDGKVTIKYPVHSLTEYFSNQFFKLFSFESLREFAEAEVNPKIVHPTAMVIKAAKKF